MALSIVRQDITEIEADAIVNSTNEHFIVGGLGVDAGIHHAAGPELDAALARIGSCPVGSAVITGSFRIKTCRYIIHAVGPAYTGGTPGERDEARRLLERCYRSALSLAAENNCASVAFPLISAGAYGFPKVSAYLIATHTIREWMSVHDRTDLDVILVLYDLDIIEISQRMDFGVLRDTGIDLREIREKRETLRSYFGERAERLYSNRRERDDLPRSGTGTVPYTAEPAGKEEDADYEAQDLSFGEMCEWWCKKKHLPKGQFLSNSNITKATFSNIRLHPDKQPKKTTVLACAVGLKLNLDQARDLLMRAGMAFSKHFPTDWLVEQYIRRGIYDIDRINFELYEMDLALLGYSKSE